MAKRENLDPSATYLPWGPTEALLHHVISGHAVAVDPKWETVADRTYEFNHLRTRDG